MLPKQWSRLQNAVVFCTCIYAWVFVQMLMVHPGSRQFYHAFFKTYQIIPPLFAGICGLAYARKQHHTTAIRDAGWLLIGWAGISFSLGQSAWTYLYEGIQHASVPSPNWADAGCLGAYPFLISGVILLFGSMHIAGRARLLLDSALAASSVGVLSWYFLVQRLWEKSHVPLVGKVINIAYPLSDLVALFCALVLLNSAASDKSRRRSLAFLATGIVLLAFADISRIYYNLNSRYQAGSWLDWGWSVGWLLIGYAALLRLWWPQSQSQVPGPEGTRKSQVLSPASQPVGPSRSLLRMLLPYIAAASAFSVIAVHDYAQDAVISNPVIIMGLWLILLVILRQVFTLLENQHLTSQLRSFNENLEGIVARRTAQMAALHQLTKAVNNTLVVDQVIAEAVKHTRQALQADAVVLWLLEGDTASSQTEDCGHQSSGAGQPSRLSLHEGLAEQPELLKFLTMQPVSSQVEIIPLPTNPQSERQYSSICLSAPLLWQQRPIGMIGAIRWQTNFAPTEAEMLESIGVEVGTAVENARQYSAAVEAADHDPVTGLYNHRAIHQRLDVEFERAVRQNHSLSVIMMDMNNFKLFNDTYGHPVGDQILKRVAQVLREECRKCDILGRYGGDEFIVVLPDTDAPVSMIVAQRLRERTMQEGFMRADAEHPIPVTLSFGIAAFPADSTNRHELLTIADANLYTAKQSEEGIMGSSETQRQHRELRTEGSFGVLDAMVTAIDNKDRYTRRHSEDVTEYALWIAEELGLSEETMRIIRVGGLLHDVGKIGVPDEILRKPGAHPGRARDDPASSAVRGVDRGRRAGHGDNCGCSALPS